MASKAIDPVTEIISNAIELFGGLGGITTNIIAFILKDPKEPRQVKSMRLYFYPMTFSSRVA
jgi:hypothetical protein